MNELRARRRKLSSIQIMPSKRYNTHKGRRISRFKYSNLINRSLLFLIPVFFINGFFYWRYDKEFMDIMDHHLHTNINQHSDQKHFKFKKNCSSLYRWQDTSFPTCNSIHEIDLGQIMHLFIKQGGFRSVWKLSLSEGEMVALKTLILQKDDLFRFDVMHNQNVDALISEKLTSSEYIVNIFQYCKLLFNPCSKCEKPLLTIHCFQADTQEFMSLESMAT